MKPGPRSTGRRIGVGMLALLAVISVSLMFRRADGPDPLTVKVTRAPLVVTLRESGTLRPAESLTYRSRVAGREIEIVWLAPEGSRVQQGEPVARLDVTDLETDLERARQAVRQAQLDVNVAEAEGQAATASLNALSSGRGALDADEARFAVRMAELKAAQRKKDYEALAPLLEKGYVTKDELARAALDLQQVEGEAELARRRATILAEQTAPQERQRAALDLAHRSSQVELARQRLADAGRRADQLRADIENCTLRAQRPGLVVYEDNLSAAPPRKIRIGDRVTPSQGLITIPEVARMLADTSLREADLHRVKVGQSAVVTLEAFPDARLTGRVVSVGTVARVSASRPFEGKRFEVIVALDPSTFDLRPEMTAHVEIKITEIASAIVVPISAVFTRLGQRVVYVAGSRGIEIRQVTPGQSDQMHVEIVDGLREGEWVRLTPEVPSDDARSPAGSSANGGR